MEKFERLYEELDRVLAVTPAVGDCSEKENTIYSKVAELRDLLFDLGCENKHSGQR